jgi:hypothetical protein
MLDNPYLKIRFIPISSKLQRSDKPHITYRYTMYQTDETET